MKRSFKGMILFVEIYANVNGFDFFSSSSGCVSYLNETTKRSFKTFYFGW